MLSYVFENFRGKSFRGGKSHPPPSLLIAESQWDRYRDNVKNHADCPGGGGGAIGLGLKKISKSFDGMNSLHTKLGQNMNITNEKK